ncbi:hypothetical protein CEXT_333041 [Caerostris extrusa]|uniref:Uncharacterized protein n=1 Tax=Caerostris extrusa TaxID=172846 RepID=A0AAV4TRA6_CAEEX|nr:hypothetical protein CEXT_333041 [Caerostris extrusa]
MDTKRRRTLRDLRFAPNQRSSDSGRDPLSGIPSGARRQFSFPLIGTIRKIIPSSAYRLHKTHSPEMKPSLLWKEAWPEIFPLRL